MVARADRRWLLNLDYMVIKQQIHEIIYLKADDNSGRRRVAPRQTLGLNFSQQIANGELISQEMQHVVISEDPKQIDLFWRNNYVT